MSKVNLSSRVYYKPISKRSSHLLALFTTMVMMFQQTAVAQTLEGGATIFYRASPVSQAPRIAVDDRLTSWVASFSNGDVSASTNNWATYGRIHASSSRNGADASSSVGWTDFISIDAPGLVGAQGLLTASVYIDSQRTSFAATSWGLNYFVGNQEVSAVSGSGATRRIYEFKIPFTFGENLRFQASATTNFVGFGRDRAEVTLAWDGISAVSLSDGRVLDINQLSFASGSNTNYRISAMQEGSDPIRPVLPGDGGQIALPGNPPGAIICSDRSLACERWNGTFVDPDVAIGYNYESRSSAGFMEVFIPYDYGDGKFELWTWNEDVLRYVDSGARFKSREVLDLSMALNQPNGVSRFSIRGIDVSAGVDPTDPQGFVTGLTWSAEGNHELSMTPVVASVPEPKSMMLWLLGLGVLATLRRVNDSLPDPECLG